MDFTTNYMGLTLRNPLVASAGPLSQTADGVKSLSDGGVGAVVMYSLFEEQLRHEEAQEANLRDSYAESYAESLSYFPTVPAASTGSTSSYVQLVEGAVKASDVPVIASLNGSTTGGWVRFAHQLQEAGAAAIELNIYMVPGDLHTTSAEVENRHLEILVGVKDAVQIPVAVKLSPYFSSFGDMALQLDQAGADGLVLFNRFFQPEINIETLEMVTGVELSRPFDGRLPRTWIAALRGRVKASLAGTSGVDTADDVVKYLLAGADVVMTTSSLVRNGPGHAATLLDGLEEWMVRKGFKSLDAVRGLLAVPLDTPIDAYERAGYVSALEKAKSMYGSLK